MLLLHIILIVKLLILHLKNIDDDLKKISQENTINI